MYHHRAGGAVSRQQSCLKERIEYPIHKEALMYHYTNEDLELLYLMSDGIDGEDADPGATQELRDLEAEGRVLPWAVL